MKIKNLTKIAFAVLALSFVSCSSSKFITNKVFLNDSEMALSIKKIEKAENAFMLYREGVSGANGGKSGGGCGCN
jgi:hypothetical protein